MTRLYGTTGLITNFGTGNARITGGYIDGTAIGANTASTGNFTTASATTLVTTNFSSGNAIITGGNITAISWVTADKIEGNYANVTNLRAASAEIFGGNVTNMWSVGTNNAIIDGGSIDGTAIGNITPSTGVFTIVEAQTANVTNGNVTTLVATNFSTANARVTGGYIDGTAIGATTANTGNFTTANAATVDSYTTNATTVNATTGNITTLTAPTINAQTTNTTVLNATTGNITTLTAPTVNATNGNITTLVATNFSTANARITGGYIDGTAIGATTANTGNFTTANATTVDSYTVNATTVNATTANITTLIAPTVDTGNITAWGINATNGNITTLVATTGFSTANARVTGGYIDGTAIGANTANTGNFTTANAATVASYTVNATTVNATAGNITTLTAPTVDAQTTNTTILNATTGNITTLTAPTINAQTTNTTILNATTGNITTLTAPTVNATNGNVTTLVATNFSTANARITGGYIDGAAVGANTASTGNFTTANAATVDAYTVNATTLNATTGNITNGQAITLVANNFSTANARITGGYIDGTAIGATTANSGAFTTVTTSGEAKLTTLNVTANVYLAPQSGVQTVTINPGIIGTIDNMSIGATSAANVYASNFRAATSLWAAPTGPVWIRGGTGTSGINNIPIGTVDPSTAVFTNANAQNLTSTVLNATSGNITTLFAQNFSTSNIVITGGALTGLSGIYATTGNITNFSTANAQVTGGYADNFPIGANVPATGAFTTLTAVSVTLASIQAQAIGNVTPGTGAFTTLSATSWANIGGNILNTSNTTTVYTAAAGTANTTGALVITGTGGAAINGNVYVGQGMVINGNKSTHDTIIRGVNERSLVFVVADSTYDQVGIGGNLTAANITQGAKLVVNSQDSILIPVGPSSERPSAKGYTDVDGMIRFNSTSGTLEYYGSGQWNNTGSTFTVITQRTFESLTGDVNGNVDGSNTQFTLSANSTTNGTLVSINGVLQIPSTAYSVTNAVVTFTEAPAAGDVIDTRVITTTSTVSSVASPAGFNQFVASNDYLSFYTGNVSLGSVENWRIDTQGDLYPVTASNIGSPTNRVDYFFGSNINLSGGTITGATVSSGSLDATEIGGNIAASGAFTTLYANSTFTTNAEHVTDDVRGKYVAPSGTDAVYSFDNTVYRSGRFFVQLTDNSGGEYQAAEVILVQNGTVASIETYGVTYTGVAQLATFSANIAASTVYLNAISASANLAIKVTPTLMKL